MFFFKISNPNQMKFLHTKCHVIVGLASHTLSACHGCFHVLCQFETDISFSEIHLILRST